MLFRQFARGVQLCVHRLAQLCYFLCKFLRQVFGQRCCFRLRHTAVELCLQQTQRVLRLLRFQSDRVRAGQLMQAGNQVQYFALQRSLRLQASFQLSPQRIEFLLQFLREFFDGSGLPVQLHHLVGHQMRRLLHLFSCGNACQRSRTLPAGCEDSVQPGLHQFRYAPVGIARRRQHLIQCSLCIYIVCCLQAAICKVAIQQKGHHSGLILGNIFQPRQRRASGLFGLLFLCILRSNLRCSRRVGGRSRRDRFRFSFKQEIEHGVPVEKAKQAS